MSRIFLAPLILLALSAGLMAGDWPEFLGAGGTAKSQDTVPSTWSESTNLLWKVDLPGTGSSSPIIVGDRLWVTCYVEQASGSKRQVLCFDKHTGKQLWATDFAIDYREDGFQGYITEHGYASNTPVCDGEHVFVFLGKGGVHALDMEGKVVWSKDVGKESSNRQWGSAASLILYGDTVIVTAAEESKSIYALHKQDGRELWRQETSMLELTYGTPRLVRLANGDEELAIAVPEEIWSLNPQTGKLKWYAQTTMTGNVCPSVIVDGDRIFSFGGYRSSGSMAVRAGGADDVSKSHTLWTSRESSYVATPLLLENKLYWIDDKGIAYCTSAETGEQIYRTRVSELEGGRPVYASPVFINGRIYVVSRRNGTFVYLPGESFKLVAQNVFAGDDTDFNASPAISDSKLYLRSNQALYCIGE